MLRTTPCHLPSCPLQATKGDVYTATVQSPIVGQSPTQCPIYANVPMTCARLKGLPASVTENDVFQFFQGLRVIGLYICRDAGGRATGEAYAELASLADCQQAMARNMERLPGNERHVEVSAASKDEVLHLIEMEKNGGFPGPGGMPNAGGYGGVGGGGGGYGHGPPQGYGGGGYGGGHVSARGRDGLLLCGELLGVCIIHTLIVFLPFHPRIDRAMAAATAATAAAAAAVATAATAGRTTRSKATTTEAAAAVVVVVVGITRGGDDVGVMSRRYSQDGRQRKTNEGSGPWVWGPAAEQTSEGWGRDLGGGDFLFLYYERQQE